MTQRLRLTFAKTEAMRFTGHLDLHHTWERTFRRAGLPLAYSQGFNPHPRLNLASALPLGFTSECEVIDVWLEQEMEPEQVDGGLAYRRCLPACACWTSRWSTHTGLHCRASWKPANSAITLLEACPDLEGAARAVLEAASLPRVRRRARSTTCAR